MQANFQNTFLLKMAAIVAAWMLFPYSALAHYEIYSDEMERSYNISQSTQAPCANGGYFTIPPKFSIGECHACQGSIAAAKKKVKDYPELCKKTKETEAKNKAANELQSSLTESRQNDTNTRDSNVDREGAANNRAKAEDAKDLRDEAKACKATVGCLGNIAPEDIAAGKTEKDACQSLADGAEQVREEKVADAEQMDGLKSTNQTRATNFQPVSAADGALAAAPAAVAAAASAVSAAMAASTPSLDNGNTVGLGNSPSYYDSTIKTWMDANKSKLSPAMQAAVANGGTATVNEFAVGGVAAFKAGKDAPSSFGDTYDSRKAKGEVGSGSGTSRSVGREDGRSYADPWLSNLSKDGFERIVSRLGKNSDLRKKVKAELEANTASPTNDPQKAEYMDFMTRALAEAESRLKASGKGALEELTPLEAYENFRMGNEEQTDNEIKRLLASVDGTVESEGDVREPLFHRIHRAIKRQITDGKIAWKRKTARKN
ncbi:MAG TPA: hypothetical protein VIH99_08715 [Bdellovibrionota bacterium]|jgi:hypothetical protein